MRAAVDVTDRQTAGEGAANEPLVEARALEKWYGPHAAIRGISFDLRPGDFLALFGPNGAGKTTLMKILAGALRPTRGEIRMAGAGARDDDHAWRRRIGVLSHQTFLYGQLTAEENLRFFGRLYSLPDLEARISSRLTEVGLSDRRKDFVRGFSRGMQQRLALARTLLHDPDLVLLDEPYTGLDPHAARMLRSVLEQLRDGNRTVVLVTHNLSEGLELANRVVVQVGGRWVLDEHRSNIDEAGFERLYGERVGGEG
ncbi:MAG: heme ABC exporter ATP-binding protein CcmA [Gemmatimonadota bacterium]|jgi:heme exporter protein A|nr:heme ABC exporter ATP-binding protein CcmA [Gemmatimonadota bacterium]